MIRFVCTIRIIPVLSYIHSYSRSRAPIMNMFASLQSVRPWPQQERSRADIMGEVVQGKNDAMSGRAADPGKCGRL